MQLCLKSDSFVNEAYFPYFQQENVSVWQAPGEGYTPEPMEFHLLNEIENKLQLLQSEEDFPALSSSSSKCPNRIYQVGYTDQSSAADILFVVCVEINTAYVCICIFCIFL